MTGSISKAKASFWLDGGYDRELVEACRYHPDHRWVVLRLGDVLQHPRDPHELMVICQGCYVPRCGGATYYDRDGRMHVEDDPCMLPRHHEGEHVAASGRTWPIGGIDA